MALIVCPECGKEFSDMAAACPSGSPAVQKIFDASKGVSFALFGVFSSKFGKQYECKNCGYKW